MDRKITLAHTIKVTNIIELEIYYNILQYKEKTRWLL